MVIRNNKIIHDNIFKPSTMKEAILLTLAWMICFTSNAQVMPGSRKPIIQSIAKWKLQKAVCYQNKNFQGTKYYLFAKPGMPAKEQVGIVLLSNFDGNLNTNLIYSIAQKLGDEGFLVGVVGHNGDQSNWQQFDAEALKVETSYRNVYDGICNAYGYTSAPLIIGGISFSGFALQSRVNGAGAAWLKSATAIILMAAGTTPYIPMPVINIVCNGDNDSNSYGNKAGQPLQDEMAKVNPSMAAKSYCITSSLCSGHNTHPFWENTIVEKVLAFVLNK